MTTALVLYKKPRNNVDLLNEVLALLKLNKITNMPLWEFECFIEEFKATREAYHKLFPSTEENKEIY